MRTVAIAAPPASLLLRLRPRIFERHGPVENELPGLGVAAVGDEVAAALELDFTSRFHSGHAFGGSRKTAIRNDSPQ